MARPPRARHRLGIALGVAMLACGAALLWDPVEMPVWHLRVRAPSFVEHVTATTARVYGAAIALAGAVVLVVSLYRLPSPPR